METPPVCLIYDALIVVLQKCVTNSAHTVVTWEDHLHWKQSQVSQKNKKQKKKRRGVYLSDGACSSLAATVHNLLGETDISRGSAHLAAEKSVLLRRVGNELPFPALLLHGAARSLQCVLSVFAISFFSLFSFTQSNGAVPRLRAAGGRSLMGGLRDLAPVAVAPLHLAAPVAAAVRRAQVWRAAGGWRGLRLAVLSGTVKLLFALVVFIVASQPVNGVVRICSRHPRLQALTSTDHHWPARTEKSWLLQFKAAGGGQWWRRTGHSWYVTANTCSSRHNAPAEVSLGKHCRSAWIKTSKQAWINAETQQSRWWQ